MLNFALPLAAALARDRAAFAGLMAVWIVIAIAIFIFSIVMYWKIATKAGYNGALSLLLLVPIVNFLMLILFAFSEWPVEQEVRRLRELHH